MNHREDQPKLHTRREFNRLLLAGAMGGLVAGSALGRRPSRAAWADEGDLPKHACKGLNDCKNQGGCKTENSDCAGHNDCKGQGGCATIEHHDCKGMNDCKNMGGCKTGADDCRGINDCKGQGGCAVPPKEEEEEAE